MSSIKYANNRLSTLQPEGCFGFSEPYSPFPLVTSKFGTLGYNVSKFTNAAGERQL